MLSTNRLRSLLVPFIAVLLLACGGPSVTEKPLPLSQQNLELLAKELSAAAQTIAVQPGQDMSPQLTKIAKQVVEEKLHYSFDLTYRVMLFFPQHNQLFWTFHELLGVPVQYITFNPDAALQEGLISQRTRDLLQARSQADQSPEAQRAYQAMLAEEQKTLFAPAQ